MREMKMQETLTDIKSSVLQQSNEEIFQRLAFQPWIETKDFEFFRHLFTLIQETKRSYKSQILNAEKVFVLVYMEMVPFQTKIRNFHNISTFLGRTVYAIETIYYRNKHLTRYHFPEILDKVDELSKQHPMIDFSTLDIPKILKENRLLKQRIVEFEKQDNAFQHMIKEYDSFSFSKKQPSVSNKNTKKRSS
jgi:hypothetical protein